MFCMRRCCYRTIPNYEINVEELKSKIAQGAVLIDVRSKQEYDEGHLQGAINIPDYDIFNNIRRNVPKLNQLVVLYCQSGGRSKNALLTMRNLGYTNVYSLYGGLNAI